MEKFHAGMCKEILAEMIAARRPGAERKMMIMSGAKKISDLITKTKDFFEKWRRSTAWHLLKLHDLRSAGDKFITRGPRCRKTGTPPLHGAQERNFARSLRGASGGRDLGYARARVHGFGMGNTWGRKVPLKEVLRKNKREINKACRELDRERANLEKQEQKLIADIKKYAGQGQMGSVKIMAKDLVRTRCASTRPMRARRGREAAARAPSEPRARLVAAGTSGRCTR